VNELRDKARFKSTLDEIFEAFAPRTDPSAPPSFIGAAYGDPLEHTTGKYVIDDILTALGFAHDLATGNLFGSPRASRRVSSDARFLGGERLPLREATRRGDRLRGWAYRIRTSMCRENIHLFEKSQMFGFAQVGADRCAFKENSLLCRAGSHAPSSSGAPSGQVL
jgi:hypothetical protein